MQHKKLLLVIMILAIIAVGCYVIWHNHQQKPKVSSASPYGNGAPVDATPTSTTAQAFDTKQFSIEEPTSPWVIVNKLRPLPNGYAPNDLSAPPVALRLGKGTDEMKMRAEAGSALKELFGGANVAGLKLLLVSGYRSQASQKALHDMYVAQKGAAAADTDSARAGYSEHQTGMAVDVGNASRTCEVDPCFANTPEGKWLKDNAYKFGFVIRYPENKQSVTGYVYEPWHIRYVGKDLAKQIYDSGKTLEEFFGLPSAPDYK